MKINTRYKITLTYMYKILRVFLFLYNIGIADAINLTSLLKDLSFFLIY